MKKIAIVNTKCCWAKKNAYAKYVIGRIKKDTGAYVAFTERPGHAEKIAKDSSGYDAIIAVGGDGTISEVVNGMDMETQTAIVMPLGSANSFARGLGIISPTKAFEVIKKNETAKIDLIHCQFETNNEKFERYIVVTSGLGFASATAAFANRCLKMAGPFCYSLSACFKPFNQEVVSAKMQIDNSSLEEIKFTNLLINNGKYAGNTCVFPKADLRDSAFNLLYTKTNALTQYLWNISIITKTYFYYPGEKTANRLHIILLKPSLFMLDGETFDSVKEIRYSVIPRSLRILT
jgi:diacylglycerol kinase family enzyme